MESPVSNLIQGFTQSRVGLTTSFDVTVDITSSHQVKPSHLLTWWIILDKIAALGHFIATAQHVL